MKTNYFYSSKLSIYSLFGLLFVLFSSCGSYQSVSYYDNDGIYGATASNQKSIASETPNKYQEYFRSLNEDLKNDVITDVDNYSSFQDSTVVTTTTNENVERNYSGWGSNASENVTINYLDEKFQPLTKTFNGITARVILHEYDHIEGKLFIDHIKPLKRTLLKGKLISKIGKNLNQGYIKFLLIY
jgi:hypothetical protein